MRGPGGGDIPVLACATCPQVAVSTGSGVGVDEPITQSVTTLPNGCRNVAVTCTSRTAGTEVNLFFSNNGVDLGTATATTMITRNLVCNANGELQLTENGVTREIDEIECISAAPACTTCTNPTLVTGSGIGVNRPVMQTRGTDTNGCATVAISCTTPAAGDDIFFFVCSIYF
uniref:C6 domain-containing protein n=1 Tax=Panagrolaimus davidi TaxID=227884 RepID=A0A914QD18_9BILA